MPPGASVATEIWSGEHTGALPTSLRACPAPKPKALDAQAPACLESGRECETLEERSALRTFARAVDKSLEEAVQNAKLARKRFERRVCDFRYSEFEEKGAVITDAYGPMGPMAPGGSYLYELRRWADAVMELNRECSKRGGDVCTNLLSHLRNFPDADETPSGGRGALGSKLYNELRIACEVGKTRAPVPNDSPVWCDMTVGLCERKSCRAWWQDVHPLKVDPRPWVDDRIEYDALKNICTAIERPKVSSADLDIYQKKAEKQALALKNEFCKPKWVDGYCTEAKPPRVHAECTLQDGRYCKHGLVRLGSEMDTSGEWKEQFQEHEIKVTQMPWPLFAVTVPRRTRVQKEFGSFL